MLRLEPSLRPTTTMTLHVPFEQFPDAVKRVLGSNSAYVSAHGGATLVTAAGEKGTAIVKTSNHTSLEDTKSALKQAGMEVFEGTWAPDEATNGEVDGAGNAHIAAVSYMSADEKPGVWVDAFPSIPTPVQVLKGMFDEFRETGELDDVSFEEFVRLANPNVVVVSPAEIQNFLVQKDPC